MFSILTPKIKLYELFEEGYVDIHSHFLPGIDDGSPDVETSINLLSQAQNMGFKKFYCTPHVIHGVWDNDYQTISNATELLKKSLPKEFPLSFAAEYMIEHDFMKIIQTEKILNLKDEYILVEFSYRDYTQIAEQVIFNLQIKGYKPILAHPERYMYFYDDYSILENFKNLGCLFQMNLLSLTDYYGEGITKHLEKLIDKGLYDFVGSDIHAQRHIDSFQKKIKKKNLSYLKELIRNNNQVFG